MDRRATTSGIVLLLLVAGLLATELVNSPYPLSGDATRGTRGGTRGGVAVPPPTQQLLLVPQPSCVDGVRNSVETDVDCGGPTCPKCASGRACISSLDCVSALCQGGVCQALIPPALVQPTIVSPPASTCIDGVKNGVETGIDCGGSVCPKCSNGASCLAASDCASTNCVDAVCQALPTCTDGVKNGAETGVDCGGSCSSKCANGVSCLLGSDCVSTSCVMGVCKAIPTCTDGLKNGLETDIDCGGPTCTKCGLSKTCSSGVDCSTAQCQNNRCCVSNVGSSCACNACGSCGGTTRCDGSCSGSTPSLPPGVDSQCKPLCTGVDTDNQGQPCGGTCTPKCEGGKLCGSDNDCLFAVSYSSGAAGNTCMFAPDGKKRCVSCDAPRSQKFSSNRNTFFEGNFVQEYLFSNAQMLPTPRNFAIIDGVTIGPVNFVTFGPGGQCLWLSLRQAGSGRELALQNPSLQTADYTSQNVEIQNRNNKIATSVLLRGAFYQFAQNCPAQIQDFTLNYRACST